MFLTEEQYNHAVGLMRKTIAPKPILAEFSDWFKGKYNLDLYDFFCDETKNGITRLKLLLWNYDDTSKMENIDDCYFKETQETILGKFAELCRKYRVHPVYQNENAAFVGYETLEDEISGHILESAITELKRLSTWDIWKIDITHSAVHIFFKTDEQLERHKKDGECERIRNNCNAIIRKHDIYNLLKNDVQIHFSSLQTVNEKFGGSTYYYYL